NTLTSYDTTTNTAGLLLGDSTMQTIQTQIYAAFTAAVPGAGQYRTMADMGFTIGDGAKLTFDENKFRDAFANDPQAVINLFTQTTTGIGAIIQNNMQHLTDPVDGAITLETQTLDSQAQSFQDRITLLNSLLANKQNQLQV